MVIQEMFRVQDFLNAEIIFILMARIVHLGFGIDKESV